MQVNSCHLCFHLHLSFTARAFDTTRNLVFMRHTVRRWFLPERLQLCLQVPVALLFAMGFLLVFVFHAHQLLVGS